MGEQDVFNKDIEIQVDNRQGYTALLDHVKDFDANIFRQSH